MSVQSLTKYQSKPLLGYDDHKPEDVRDGNSSNVYFRKRQSDKKLYAMKTLKLDPEQDEEFQLWNENNTLQYMNNDNSDHIIRLMGFTNDNQYLIFEYHPHETLEGLTQKGGFPIKIAKGLMVQIATEIQTLHVGTISHGDLKLRNIFISEQFKIVIGDFGYSQINGEHQRIIDYSMEYAAPECRNPVFDYKQTLNDQRSIDIFALGVLFFRLQYGIEPFNNADNKNHTDLKWNLLSKIEEGCNIEEGQIGFWNLHHKQTGILTPFDFQQMIQGMLNSKSSQRWSIQQVLGCQFFQGEGEIANEEEVSLYIEQRVQNQN